MERLIKSKKRVQDFAEVYTAKKQVNDMLSLVPDSELTTTYLEPACGNGNFIEAILKRKMDFARKAAGGKQEYALFLLVAVSSIYGVDIQEDNVEETKERVSRIVYKETEGTLLPAGYRNCLSAVLSKNIICGNTLTGLTSSGGPVSFYEWHLDGRMLKGTAYSFEDMLLNGGEGTVPTDSIIYSLSGGTEEMTA